MGCSDAGCAAAREEASKPYSLQLPDALDAGTVTRSKVRAGRLGSCGRQSDLVMAEGSNAGEIVEGARAGASGLVSVEPVQDSPTESKLARREPLLGDAVTLGQW